MLSLWKRLLLMNDNRITKKIFMWDWRHKGTTWSSSIRSILKDCQILVNQGCNFATLSSSCIIAEARSSLLKKLQTSWSKAILNQSKLRTCILFKTDYCADNYVTANLTRPERSVIAQLRAGILPLNIELMRYGQFHKPELRVLITRLFMFVEVCSVTPTYLQIMG